MVLMRTSHTCPKCACKRLYVVSDVHQPDTESSNGLHRFFVHAAPVAADVTGSAEGTRYRTHAGRFESWVCSHCGFTEWYARDPERVLEALSRDPEGGVRVVEAQDTPAPYR